MEEFKIDLFNQENHGEEFPWFRTLSLDEQANAIDNILLLLKISSNTTSLELVKEINEIGEILPDFNAELPGFRLSSVLKSQGIVPKDKVLINWYRFDNIDQFYFDDLNKHFDSIWYPGPDDIDIFDESFSWVLSVSHSGVISIIGGQGHSSQ